MPPFGHHHYATPRRRPYYLAGLTFLSGVILFFTLSDHAPLSTPAPFLRGDLLKRPTLHDYAPLSKAQIVSLLGAHDENVEQRFILREQNPIGASYEEARVRMQETLLLGKLLDRVPVLPEAMWVTECTMESEACSAAALKHLDSRDPLEDKLEGGWPTTGEAWLMEIHEFLDLPFLRKSFGPALTLAEFLTFCSLNNTVLLPDGNLNLPTASTILKISTLNTSAFDSSAILVDRPSDALVAELASDKGLTKTVSHQALSGRLVWTLEEAVSALKQKGWKLSSTEERALEQLSQVGAVPLYSFAPESRKVHAIQPLLTEISSNPAKLEYLTDVLSTQSAPSPILHLAGSIPSDLRFSSVAGREEYRKIVSKCIRPPKVIRDSAATAVKAMALKVQEPRWIGVHLQPKSEEIDKTSLFRVRDSFFLSPFPRFEVPNAINISSLLTPADLKKLGWLSGFPALLRVVEEQVLARSHFFLGSRESEVTGAVVNARVGLAKDAQWGWLD